MNDTNTNIRHLGIIMDGNRRWAKEHNLPKLIGHKKGVDALERVGDWCIERGIKHLTVWAFSTENWNRSKEEVTYLMRLMKEVALTKVKGFMKKGVRLKVLGRLSEVPKDTRDALEYAIEKTKQNTKCVLHIGFNYGGRIEIVDAVRNMLGAGLKPELVTEQTISQYMYDPEMPDPDLVIRTGGDERSSGFLLWETPYSEWYYTDKKWPEFDEAELDRAIGDFKARTRNFGK